MYLMKNKLMLTWILAVAVGQGVAAEMTTKTTFDRFKELKGQWEMEGNPKERITFEVMSEGHVVLETAMGMINTIHWDGDGLRLTHFCAANNQPSFILKNSTYESPDYDFDLTHVGNEKPGVGHISDVRYRWLPNGHLEELWTYTNDNGESGTERFVLKRVEP